MRYKKVQCPFCDSVGTRTDTEGTKQCPACDGIGLICVSEDDNFYSKKDGPVKGRWGRQFENLNEQGVPDAE